MEEPTGNRVLEDLNREEAALQSQVENGAWV